MRTLPFLDRVITWEWVLPAGDADVFYHVRRVVLATAQWPRVPDFDSWMNHPHGGFAPWPPLFTFVAATAARWAEIDPVRVAVFVPPVLAALAIVPFYVMLRALGIGASRWVALALFALLPAHVAVGVLGRVDHHVAEVLLQLWVYAWLSTDLRVITAGGRVSRTRSLAFGVLLGASLLIWAASVVYLWVVVATACLVMLPTRETRDVRAVAHHVGIAFLTAAAVCAPWVASNVARGRDAFAYYHLSALTVVLCGAGAAAVFGTAWMADMVHAGRSRRAMVALALGCLGALAPFASGEFRQGLFGGLGFITRTEGSFASTIIESAPLLATPTTRAFAAQHLGNGHWLLPPLCLALVWRAWRGGGRDPTRTLIAVWALNVTFLAFLQARFLYYAAPLVAASPVLAAWLARARPRLASALAGLCGLAVLPAFVFFWSPALTGGQVPISRIDPTLLEFLLRVQRVTPSAGDTSDPTTKPTYGIAAPWGLGHLLVVVSERAVVANNFGDQMEGGAYAESQRFFNDLATEGDAGAWLDARDCQYVVTTPMSVRVARAEDRAPSLMARLHLYDGSDAGGDLGSGHFRLVAVAPSASSDGGATHKLFERVPGAMLVFDAPGAHMWTVDVQRAVDGYSFRYTRRTRLEGDRFVVRIAQPGRYRMRDGSMDIGVVDVELEAVRSGRRIHVAAPAPSSQVK